MKIATYQFEKKQGAQLETMLKSAGYDVLAHKAKLHEEDYNAEVETLCIFAGCIANEASLDGFPNLKLIVTGSTGFDHIDLPYCASRGIVVCNVPAYGAETVAEHAMALLLGLTRRIPQLVQRCRQGNHSLEGMEGMDLSGKTIGVVGTGRIGCNMIQIAKGFDMKVIAFDLFPNTERAADMGFEYVDFDTLLQQSDVISFHVPGTPETHHLLNPKNIHNIKKGAYLINTARGEVIDNTALKYALQNDILEGLGLDVMDNESQILEDNPDAIQEYILTHKKTLFTPHAGFCTSEAKQRILDTILDNIKAFEAGKPINTLSA